MSNRIAEVGMEKPMTTENTESGKKSDFTVMCDRV